MRTWLLGLATGAGVAAGTAGAQVPYPGTSPAPGYPAPTAGYPATGYGYPGGGYPTAATFLPNFYNRQTQPLSPYLNLFRGNNPAVNYYYGVRPGTPAGQAGLNSAGVPISGGSQVRAGFLPLAAAATPEPVELPPAGQPVAGLGPSGHPVSFGGLGRGVPVGPRAGILPAAQPRGGTAGRR